MKQLQGTGLRAHLQLRRTPWPPKHRGTSWAQGGLGRRGGSRNNDLFTPVEQHSLFTHTEPPNHYTCRVQQVRRITTKQPTTTAEADTQATLASRDFVPKTAKAGGGVADAHPKTTFINTQTPPNFTFSPAREGTQDHGTHIARGCRKQNFPNFP